MKKIYAIAASLLFVGAVSAQTTEIIKDGGFEGTFVPGSAFNINSTNVSGVTTDMQSADWIGIMKQAPSAITGSKSAVAVSVDDQVAAETLWGAGTEAKTGGFIQQVYEGALPTDNPNNMVFSFKYTYVPSGVDTAFALVQIIDTTLGTNGAILWQGVWGSWDTTATATEATITTWQANPNATGTANSVVVMFGTSAANFYDDTPAPLGSALTVDDVSWTFTTVGVNDVTNNVAKVYPNPTSEMLNIEIANTKATSISVYGVDGKVVLTKGLTGVQSSVNVSNLNNGVYFYNITTIDGNVLNGSFVKE